MTIELTDTSTVLAAFFISTTKNMDWMGAIYKANDEAPWRLRCRLRVYASADPFDADDEKRWTTLEYKGVGSDEEVFAQAVRSVEKIAARLGGTLQILRGPYTSDQYIEVLKKQPWAHIEKHPKSIKEESSEPKTTLLDKPISCPYCGTTLVAASEKFNPKAQVVGICVRCENPVVWIDRHTARKSTEAETKIFESDPDYQRCKIMIAKYKEKYEGVKPSQTIN